MTSGVGNERKKVCLVVGAGGGIGGHVAQRFARGGEFHAVLCRRSDGEGLQRMVSQISAAEEGGATGRLLNVVEEGSIEQLIADVETNIGPIHTAVYNIGAQFGDRSLAQTSQKAFEMGWRLGTLGLFRLATAVLPHMAERGTGALIVTSATAAVRGNPGQHSHASAMGGRRMLCQTLNGEFARKGVHVAHVLVDGAVDGIQIHACCKFAQDAPKVALQTHSHAHARTLSQLQTPSVKCWVLRNSRNFAQREANMA